MKRLARRRTENLEIRTSHRGLRALIVDDETLARQGIRMLLEQDDVVAGSPADIAGIKAGDTVLAIDGKAASSLELTAVRERFRSDPVGSRLQLRVQSGADVKDIILSLRELV